MLLRRQFLALGMTTAVAATLAACGSSSDGSGAAGSSEVDTSTEITLKVWESLLGPDDFIKQAGQKFTELHPNITIEFVNVEVGDASKQIPLDGPAGNGPDVFAAPHDTLGDLVTGGHVLAVADVDSLAANVTQSALTADTWTDGTVYGYPVAAETYALYYNKDLVSEVPTTFEGLISFARDFNAANSGKYGYVMDVGNFYYTFPFMTKGGNRLFGDDGLDDQAPNLNAPEAVEGFTGFQRLREVLPVAAADLSTDTVDGLFASGNAAIHLSGPWNVKNFTDSGISFGVAPVFALDGDSEPATTFAGVRTMFVSAYTDHPAEAAAFAAFLTTPEMQQLRADITGMMGVSTSSLTYESEATEGFSQQMEHTFAMPKIARMAKVWDALNAASSNIWDGADVAGELSAAQNAVLAD
ncbi:MULTISPECIES: maltose ABC transporter substrate-binding protein [unclassified Actinomyces]|uniref:sugar ABC transporter substrate-binding protein n=1 Tax=unclassified Actinomyces TaxID=2609248 RepID=UPI00201745C9|nr:MULTISPECIES: maltose ABC transporter substrate-binding protein [unclassified Actinomyces]MCL3777869.1 maltose ABC transporter substrate-binding protein [Actinomyces sp. AC-20-1]MCL3789250.1 maltose ABC transporter substrate-binding protein [Actinomyces sp. 187325]MCL3791603.1 maltose ABC transporter substrate-binding protein [Actinomyces sp. 186855]MCL3793545.1 maltose ABC transporter substrate-binding protein [Actinomyces sp. 217892]